MLRGGYLGRLLTKYSIAVWIILLPLQSWTEGHELELSGGIKGNQLATRLGLTSTVWLVWVVCYVYRQLLFKIKCYSSAKITTTTGHYLLSLGITDNMCTHNTQAVKYLRAMSWFFELAFSYNQQMAEKRIAVNKIRRHFFWLEN